jgi:hypothetical protein
VKVLATAVNASMALKIDADRRALWLDRLSRMAPFPTLSIKPTPPSSTNVTVFVAQEYPRYFPGSTNPLAFYAMWPGEQVGADSSDDIRRVARDTVEQLGADGAWSQGNAFPESFPAAVRAGVPPEWVVGNMTNVINATMPHNILGGEGQVGSLAFISIVVQLHLCTLACLYCFSLFLL